MLRINHDGDTRVFLNGQLIYEKTERMYTAWNFDEKATALLKDGDNILAIKSTAGSHSHYLDVSLFDMKNEKGDDILFSPGQPNILHGPNGFEWWLIYMANKNSDRRGQYINRVHFFDKRMFVDGVTSTKTPGYHPAPATPTFSDLFKEDEWQTRWNINSGAWTINNKEFVQTGTNTAKAFIKSLPAAHYLFQSGIKMIDTAVTKGGVIAWWKDENNWVRIFLNPKSKTWSYAMAEKGKQRSSSFPLPKDFKFNVYHTLSVYKNGSSFSIKIDDLPAPVSPDIKTNFAGKGLPGLYTEGGRAAFDGILYTIGWDEYDTTIGGWNSVTTENNTAHLKVTTQGITLSAKGSENMVFKGDDLATYEFSTQLTIEDKDGSAGIYPVFIDRNNYLKAIFDFSKQSLIISGKKEGKEVVAKEISLEGNKDYHADMKYTDFFEKHFTLHTPTSINAVRLSKTPHAMPDTAIEDIYKKMTLYYKRHDKWYPIKKYKEEASTHPGFEQISFQPVEAEALKFVNKTPDDRNFYINKIWVTELFRQSYNIRIARLKDNIIFIVDGKEVLNIKNDFPPSKVGLVTKKGESHFNGITLFHLSQ